MIIEGIFNIFFTMIEGLFSFIDFPDAPDEAYDMIDSICDSITNSIDFINFIIPLSYVIPLIVVIVACNNVEKVYEFLMWIVKKIPMLGIE